MKIQLIRNATMKITYAGRTFLTDPILSPKWDFEAFAGIAPNPTIDLPFQIEDIIKGMESVVVTHDHPDPGPRQVHMPHYSHLLPLL